MQIKQYQKSYISKKLKVLFEIFAFTLLVFFLLSFFWLDSIILWDGLNLTQKFAVALIEYGPIFVVVYLSKKYKFLQSIVSYYAGKVGEDSVAKILKENFDDTYAYIRNFIAPGGYGDTDGILITPHKIFIIEIKNYSADYLIQNGIFYRLYPKGKKYRLVKSPIDQVLEQKEYLLSYFEKHGIKIPIQPLVVFARGQVSIRGKSGVYIV